MTWADTRRGLEHSSPLTPARPQAAHLAPSCALLLHDPLALVRWA